MAKCSTNLSVDELVPFPHVWVNPSLLIDSDDSTFACCNLKGRREVQVWRHRKRDKCSRHATYTMQKEKKVHYCRIKHHAAISAGPTLAPIILSTKIKQREWGSLPQNFVIIKIPGTYNHAFRVPTQRIPFPPQVCVSADTCNQVTPSDIWYNTHTYTHIHTHMVYTHTHTHMVYTHTHTRARARANRSYTRNSMKSWRNLRRNRCLGRWLYTHIHTRAYIHACMHALGGCGRKFGRPG